MGLSKIKPISVSDQLNASTGAFDIPSGTTAQRPTSPSPGYIRYNTDINNTEIYTGTFWGPIEVSWGSYVASFATPNGGTQNVRFLFDKTGLWALVGRFSASAKDSIQTVFSSVRGLSTSLDQNTTAMSADFGDYYPTKVRVLACTDFSNWRNSRVLDWNYGVPFGRPWKYFLSGGATSGLAFGGDNWSNSARYGFGCAGVYDGFERWTNPNYTFMRMSDGNVTHDANAFTTPTSNAFNWNSAGDAKLSCHATAVSSGQDTENHGNVGSDDDYDVFYDTYPSVTGASTYPVNASCALWLLIKIG